MRGAEILIEKDLWKSERPGRAWKKILTDLRRSRGLKNRFITQRGNQI